jgi:DNA-binding NarL/FixJ family response regulator
MTTGTCLLFCEYVVTKLSATPAARLLIVDDHALARTGMRRLLGGAHDVEIVGEAGDGDEAIGMAERLRPDLVLMDVRLQDMDGLAATRAIRAALPEISVLLITMYDAPEYASQAERAGAAGYLLKGASRRELLAALRGALRAGCQPASAISNQPTRPAKP